MGCCGVGSGVGSGVGCVLGGGIFAQGGEDYSYSYADDYDDWTYSYSYYEQDATVSVVDTVFKSLTVTNYGGAEALAP